MKDVTKIREAARRAAELAQELEQAAEEPPKWYDVDLVDRLSEMLGAVGYATDEALGELVDMPLEGEATDFMG